MSLSGRPRARRRAGTEKARSTPYPIIQGHENVGVVAAIGARVVPAPNRAYEGTLALLARQNATVGFADMISHRIEVQDAPEAMRTALDADASAKVLNAAA